MSLAGLHRLAPGYVGPDAPPTIDSHEAYRATIDKANARRSRWAAIPVSRGRVLGWRLLRWWYLSIRWLDLNRPIGTRWEGLPPPPPEDGGPPGAYAPPPIRMHE